jgi:magnesium-protoporphyrin O-methyltransferase
MVTMMSYEERRSEVEHYFDRTAVEAWSRLTSTEPVSRVRQTVRVGRERMRQLLLGWLPSDLTGMRVLDAGCGTGALAVDAARRGANVLAIDLSPTLIELAQQRLPEQVGRGRIDFRVGDMSRQLGNFNYVVAMDSLIHYCVEDAVALLGRIADSVEDGILFTYAPRTPLLASMHAVGRMFPRGDRAPSIEPVATDELYRLLTESPQLSGFRPARTECVRCGFYTSQALELVRR